MAENAPGLAPAAGPAGALARPRVGWWRRTLAGAFWDAYASVYDGLPRHFRPYSMQLARVVDHVKARHRPGSARVLDAGCGTGNYVTALSKVGYEVVGIDRAPWMLSRARLKAALNRPWEGNGVAPATFCRASLTDNLPFADSSFDCVISINALYMLNFPEVALGEFKRVIRPGGTLILSHPRRMPGLGEIMRDHAKRFGVASVLCPLFTFGALGFFNWVISRNFRRGGYFCWSEGELRDAVGGSGFAVEKVEQVYACQSNHLLLAVRQKDGAPPRR